MPLAILQVAQTASVVVKLEPPGGQDWKGGKIAVGIVPLAGTPDPPKISDTESICDVFCNCSMLREPEAMTAV